MSLSDRFENNLKGEIAECLARELFLINGYNVHDYGVEHIVPGYSSSNNSNYIDQNCKNSKSIRFSPDFIVVKKGRADFIEVKYRSDGRFQVEDDYPYLTSYILLFNPVGIEISNVEDLIKFQSGELMDNPLKKIEETNCFIFSKESIKSCIYITTKYFDYPRRYQEEVLFPKRKMKLFEKIDKKTK